MYQLEIFEGIHFWMYVSKCTLVAIEKAFLQVNRYHIVVFPLE